jgi:hypothetical protein
MKKLLIIIFLISLLSSCTGTGNKTKPIITTSNSGNTILYFTRQGGYIAGGVLAKIEVNGREIARLGTKENITHNVSTNFRINVSGSGLSGIGMGGDSISGVANGKNSFYIIGVKQGFFSTKFIINETTESGYKQSE